MHSQAPPHASTDTNYDLQDLISGLFFNMICPLTLYSCHSISCLCRTARDTDPATSNNTRNRVLLAVAPVSWPPICRVCIRIYQHHNDSPDLTHTKIFQQMKSSSWLQDHHALGLATMTLAGPLFRLGTTESLRNRTGLQSDKSGRV